MITTSPVKQIVCLCCPQERMRFLDTKSPMGIPDTNQQGKYFKEIFAGHENGFIAIEHGRDATLLYADIHEDVNMQKGIFTDTLTLSPGQHFKIEDGKVLYLRKVNATGGNSVNVKHVTTIDGSGYIDISYARKHDAVEAERRQAIRD